jgi:hypothetical protein
MGDTMTKILRSIYFDVKQVEKLIGLSKKTRIPQAVLLREGIDLVLKKHEKQSKNSECPGKNDVQEKRAFARVLTNLKAQYRLQDNKGDWKKCTIINIHHKGFGLEVHSVKKIKEGERFLFEIFLSNNATPIDIQGTVRWTKERTRYCIGGILVASIQDEDKLTKLVRHTLGIKKQ